MPGSTPGCASARPCLTFVVCIVGSISVTDCARQTHDTRVPTVHARTLSPCNHLQHVSSPRRNLRWSPSRAHFNCRTHGRTSHVDNGNTATHAARPTAAVAAGLRCGVARREHLRLGLTKVDEAETVRCRVHNGRPIPLRALRQRAPWRGLPAASQL